MFDGTINMFSVWDIIWFGASLAIGFWMLRLLNSIIFRHRVSSNGKAVLITGCDSGFGYLLSQRMAGLGYKVFAGCLLIDGKGAQELKSFSSNIRVFHLDITNDQNVVNATKLVSEELQEKELWAIVNNAGIVHSSEMEWTPLQTILDVFNVNTFGMVRVTQHLLPMLKKSKGRIVNATSIIAERLITGTIAYSMSKAAAKSFNDVARLELRKWGIKVINIAPYFYGTKITDIEKLVSMAKDAWDRSDPNIREELGNGYLEDTVVLIRRFIGLIINPRVNEVVDCMEDAITSSAPKICYKPGNLLNKLVFDIIIYFPVSVQDYIQSLILPSLNKS